MWEGTKCPTQGPHLPVLPSGGGSLQAAAARALSHCLGRGGAGEVGRGGAPEGPEAPAGKTMDQTGCRLCWLHFLTLAGLGPPMLVQL